MCVLIVEGRPVLVAYTGGEFDGYTHTPFSAPSPKKTKDQEKVTTAVNIQKVLKKAVKDLDIIPMNGSVKRSKTAINEDQKFDRRERNRARRKIVIGKRTACQVTKYNLEKGAVVTTTEMLPDDSYLVTVSHRSAGLHGGKPRYKDHRLDAIGKAGELRAKHKRPVIHL